MIVANDLQRGHWWGDAKEMANFAVEPLRRGQNRLRSAILRGLDKLEDLSSQHEPAEYLLPDVSRLTRSADLILPKLCAIARTMDLPTRKSVAAADYGDRTGRQLEALETVLADDTCLFPIDDSWYPSEVVELVSYEQNAPGFVPCTALLIANAIQGRDNAGWFEFRWRRLAAEYNILPKSTRDPFLAGLRYLYETGEDFVFDNDHRNRDPVLAPEGMIDFVEFTEDSV
ncbi:hypothetical protein [Puniceibacterium sp. IMCC21224]|uniref:hypothetical protein n=1 Tax=Puniceibacterium sp. IMCC21224 TaxID=1618204 RepID=UPI00064DD4A3|nr:hypothetical protein [Puniceibacterium sp. IMCC21224]KMK68495.1 hypothetical protein IMCC21224_113377 [Puniceibacterium sp. IMCC21224]